MQDKYALVTGASSGLGIDFARQLAQHGCRLILVARREDRLRALQEELQRQHESEVTVIPMDLTPVEAPQQLFDTIKGQGKVVDVLINNAGFGVYGNFVEIDWERERSMLELNIRTVVHLTRLCVQDMLTRNFGFVLQLASTGAYQPTPLYASYAATKSFVLNFGEAINYELRQSGVSCTVVSPGITATEFLQVSGQQPTLYQRLTMMQSDKVARIGIEAMLKRKPSVIPGFFNNLSALSVRLMPRWLVTAVAHRMMAQ